MNARIFIISVVIGAGLIFSSGASAACPCHPCKCSPCTCGGSKSSGGGGKHHGKDHGHGGSSFGVGGTVDLGGILHRDAEANPFGVSNGEKPVTHTEEKRTTKRKEKQPTSSTFDEIKLTGKEAKDENNPPNTFNVDNEEPPKLPPSEVFTPKTPSTPSDPMEDLKKAHDDYLKAWADWAKKQPGWNSLVHDWTQSSSSDEGIKKSAAAKKKIDKMNDQFNAGDGKQLVDDWKTKFDNALKTGGKVEDNGLVPPPKDDIEKKKYAVIKAQNDLDKAKQFYDWARQNGAFKDDEVKKAQDALSNSGATSTNDPKYKAALADLEKAMKDAGAKWAGTEEGKQEAQKLHDAEKELDKAKEDWKPFEKYVEK
jgi:hypothetical protein